MSVADSIPIFSQGSFEDQVLELVEYLARSVPEAEQPNFIEPFQDSVKTDDTQKPFSEDKERRRTVVTKVIEAINGLGDGTDVEVEGFYNLAYYQLCGATEPNSPEFLSLASHIIGVVVKESASDRTQLKYRLLANLYNSTPRMSSFRFIIVDTLFGLAAEHDELDVLHLNPSDVERWLQEWDVSQKKKSDFLKTITDKLLATKPEASYEYRIAYVRTLPPTSEAAKPAALELLATALRSPSNFDFDTLQKIENVKALSSHELFRLLQIFAKEGLSEYQAWVSQNEPLLELHRLTKDQLLRKMRLLIFSSLAFNKIGQRLTYAEIASALQIDETDVERWTVDVIRASLLSGKLSQATQTLHVVRASPRGFGSEQWAVLEQRLLAWKTGLAGIQAVLISALQTASTKTSLGVTEKLQE